LIWNSPLLPSISLLFLRAVSELDSVCGVIPISDAKSFLFWVVNDTLPVLNSAFLQSQIKIVFAISGLRLNQGAIKSI
jgi:hypothetical protein